MHDNESRLIPDRAAAAAATVTPLLPADLYLHRLSLPP